MKTMNKNFMALAVVCLSVIAIWFTNRTIIPKAASWQDVVSEAEAGGYKLVTTDDLWKKYSEEQDKIMLVDTRQAWEFRSGHIKNAVNFPTEPTWLSRFQKRSALEKFLGADKNRTVVFY